MRENDAIGRKTANGAQAGIRSEKPPPSQLSLLEKIADGANRGTNATKLPFTKGRKNSNNKTTKLIRVIILEVRKDACGPHFLREMEKR